MNKSQLKTLGVSEDAIAALEAGKGNRAIGTTNGITVGNTYKILGVDFRSSIMQDREDDLEASEFRALPDEEKLQHGRKSEWFVLVTNNGDVSFTALFGVPEMQNADFWNDDQANIRKAEDFDVEKIFVPSCRTPSAFIEANLDGLKGKKVRVVARKEWNNGYFDTKAIAFVIE